MSDVVPFPVEPSPAQSREHMINGMRGVIRRMCRLGGVSAVTGSEVYCLVDYDDRELAAALLAYVEGRPTWIER